MSSLVIAGGDIVAGGAVRRGDVLVADDKIAAVGEVPRGAATTVIDASGCYVVPGGVDVHTHLDLEVGAVSSADDFTSGTRAAACGGTTTVIDFATAYGSESISSGLAKWHAKADGRAVVDYAFHMTFTELTRPADDVLAEIVEAGITSVKLYMTYPERLMVSDHVIREVMRAAERHRVLVALHCEDDSQVAARRAEALAAGRVAPKWHAWSRPPEAEAAAVRRAVAMAEDTGAALYVVHLSSAPALAEIRAARERGLPVFAETCPQYLYLDAAMLDRPDESAARFVCAPPLRDRWHQEELWEGLAQGHLQVVSTDHCPFDGRSKDAGTSGRGWRDFTEIPGGLPGIETRLALVYQRVLAGDLTLEQWVDRCCEMPARLFGLSPAKGTLAPGADADVVVFDPRLTRQLVPERLHTRCDYSAYEHLTVTGWPRVVLARGRVVAENGEPVGEAGAGRFLRRASGRGA